MTLREYSKAIIEATKARTCVPETLRMAKGALLLKEKEKPGDGITDVRL